METIGASYTVCLGALPARLCLTVEAGWVVQAALIAALITLIAVIPLPSTGTLAASLTALAGAEAVVSLKVHHTSSLGRALGSSSAHVYHPKARHPAPLTLQHS